MRLYKIINDEKKVDASKFIKEMADQNKANSENIQNNITPFPWTLYSGWDGGFNLLTTYHGFKPEGGIPEEIPTGWKIDKDNAEILTPNLRTKLGRSIRDQLRELKNWSFHKIYDVLNIQVDTLGRFTIPGLYVSQNKEEVYLKIDAKVDLSEEDFEEVTLTYVNKMLGIKK